MALRAHEVLGVHLEITERCNAACPMCLRNINGGPNNPYITNAELSLVDIQRAMPPDFVRQINHVSLCGNFGDPAAARDLLPVVRYLKDVHPYIAVRVRSNGSLRTPEWWGNLAGLMTKEADFCNFGIDGLADTHHLYRRQTSFEKILENARAFIAAGGKAIWDYLIFKHNEHQVEEARALASQMGFVQFIPKRSYRFRQDGRFPVANRDGEVIYHLEAASREGMRNPHISPQVPSTPLPGSITCKVRQTRSVYLSARGFVFPCCWTASMVLGGKLYEDFTDIVQASGGIDALHVSQKSIAEIVDGPAFRAVEQAWLVGGPTVCAKTCGKKDAFGAQVMA